MTKKIIALIVSLALIVPVSTMAQDKLPVPDSPSSWVNDYANVFSAAEVSQLERKLNEFEYRTSTQIFVITLDDNGGYPVSMLTPLIGERWGVGQKGKDNGHAAGHMGRARRIWRYARRRAGTDRHDGQTLQGL